jgi:hypothetical protein
MRRRVVSSDMGTRSASRAAAAPGSATSSLAHSAGYSAALHLRVIASVEPEPVTEPPNYTRLSRKIIQREDNLTNLSPYNPVVREISTDFKPFI